MTSSISTVIAVAATAAFFGLAFLAAFAIHEFSEGRRLKEERAERAKREATPNEADGQRAVNAPGNGDERAYSYPSIIMDEVLEEKLIEELKESLRMTEDAYRELSERFKDDRDRRIELANDWLNYLEAIDNIKQARIDYRMNSADEGSSRVERDSARVKLEVENKFKNLLQSVPPHPPGQPVH